MTCILLRLDVCRDFENRLPLLLVINYIYNGYNEIIIIKFELFPPVHTYNDNKSYYIIRLVYG